MNKYVLFFLIFTYHSVFSQNINFHYLKAEQFLKNCKWDSSRFYFEKASSVYLNLNNKRGHFNSRISLAEVYACQNANYIALNILQNIENDIIKINDEVVLINLYRVYSIIYSQIPDWRKTRFYASSLIKMSSALKVNPNFFKAEGYYFLAVTYAGNIQQKDKMNENILKVMDILNKHPEEFLNPVLKAKYFILLGKNYHNAGAYILPEFSPLKILNVVNFYKKAISCYNTALKIGKNDPIINIKAFHNIGNAYNDLSHKNNGFSEEVTNFYNSKAKENYFKSIEWSKKMFGKKSYSLSLTYFTLGILSNRYDHSESLKWFSKSLNTIILNDTSLLLKPSIDACINLEMLNSSIAYKSEALHGQYDRNKGLIYLISAFNHDEANIELIDKVLFEGSEELRYQLLDNYREAFTSIISNAWKLYNLTNENIYLEKAFLFSEKSKSYSLYYNILKQKLKGNFIIPQHLKDEELLIKNKINLTNDSILLNINSDNKIELSSLKQNRQKLLLLNKNLINRIGKTYPVYNFIQNQKLTIPINKVQALLKNDEILIDYFQAYEKMFVFVITKNSIRFLNLSFAKDGELEMIIQGFFNSMFNNQPKFFQESSNNLYNKVFKPVEDVVDLKDKKLIVISDGHLNKIPFDALVTKQNENKTDFRKFNYLILKRNISFQLSVALWIESSEKRNINKIGITGFSPNFNYGLNKIHSKDSSYYRFNDIPFSKELLIKLSKSFKGDFYLDNDANKKNFNNSLKENSILHIASHASNNLKVPDSSFIVLTNFNKNKEDSFIFLSEIYQLNLSSPLVILEGCNTGKGKNILSEGLMSFARGYTMAGSSSVMMSLWSVDDKFSSDLTEDFYYQLKNKNYKSEALRNCKLNLISKAKNSDESNPFYWAGFIIIGNNDKLNLDVKTDNQLLIILSILMTICILIFLFKRKIF